MIRSYTAISLAFIFALAFSCRKPELQEESDFNEWLSGGSQTVFDEGGGAFSQAFPFMSEANEEVHEIGDAAFEATFVTAPAPFNYGLGPVFNNVSCVSCHIGDGRGKPPLDGEPLQSLLIRVSVPGRDVHGGPLAVPGFGGQLQQRAVTGKSPEADVNYHYSYDTLLFGDGTSFVLRTPHIELVNPHQPFPAGMMVSPRVAPPVFGLGLLEAVPESQILEYADVNDANGDGIFGKPNYSWDVIAGEMRLGRFGWKAVQPTVLQQSAGAYNEDMGITNFIFNTESCFSQQQYDNLLDESEVSDSLLHAVAFYIRTLAVPARRNADDPVVKRGKEIFKQAQCASCHRPSMTTRVDVAFPEMSNQKIFPYSDMLLHEMGPALADNRHDFNASGSEWRTPPLWGIGLTQVVNGHNNFLHDGRARTLLEAIMWHGGEAESSKNHVKNLSASDREALIKFLESL